MHVPAARSRSRTFAFVAAAAAAAIGLAGCHTAPPSAKTAPRPAAPNADSVRAARVASVKADSIARAMNVRRTAEARAKASADSARVAEEERRHIETSARAELVAPTEFAFDRADLRMPERTMLDRKAAILLANHAIRMRIDGNADERGSDTYNLALGMRRALAAQHYLTEHGVDANRLDVTSSGEANPICHEHEEWCWSQNRRDDFVIVAGGERITAGR